MATEIDILQLPTAEVIQEAEAAAIAAKNEAVQAKTDAENAAASVPTEESITAQIEALTEEAIAPVVTAVAELPAATSTAIAKSGIAVRSGRTAAAMPYPKFEATGDIVWTAAETGLETVYWPNVTNVSVLPALPGDILFACSTDHSTGAAANLGIAIAWSDDPFNPGPWQHVTIVGLPATLVQIETPSVNVDKARNRLVMTFQAQDTAANNLQNTYICTTTDGIIWTYLGIVAPWPATNMGDGHAGYMGPATPWGNGYIAGSLAGGTIYSAYGFRATLDFETWVPIGPQVVATSAAWKYPDWPNTRYFRWRGEQWGVIVKSSTQPVSGYNHETHCYVVRFADDLRTMLGEPIEIMPEVTDGFIQSIVARGDDLIGYYRSGGNTGSIKTAIAKG